MEEQKIDGKQESEIQDFKTKVVQHYEEMGPCRTAGYYLYSKAMQLQRMQERSKNDEGGRGK